MKSNDEKIQELFTENSFIITAFLGTGLGVLGYFLITGIWLSFAGVLFWYTIVHFIVNIIKVWALAE